MTDAFPVLFVSHGSPLLVGDGSQAHEFLKTVAQDLPRPKNILVVSAHWETETPAVSLSVEPPTIHDFVGFPRALHELRYPAPGAKDLGKKTACLLEAAGLSVRRDPSRGLDHGAWVPLKLIYPKADIPVTQLSIQPHESPAYHMRVGEALRSLRDEGTLILASGSITHNLRAYFQGGFGRDAAMPDWVSIFSDWIAEALEQGRIKDLANYRELAPFAVRNHPTDEHLLPLFVACGSASDSLLSRRLHKSGAYGVLAMDAYELG
ncbi:MAG: class III extradiol ring-cleavage dioxygenase [Pseudomonadota bacterium]